MEVSVIYWNINGRWRFFKDANIVSWISQFSIVFLLETHFTKGQIFELENYKSYHNSYSKVTDRKARWGISCFVSKEVLPNVLNVDCGFANHILVTMKGSHRIFGSYIPPSDSIYYEDEYYYSVSCFLSPINNDRIFIGGGDLNSRVGNCNQTLSTVNAKYRPNPDTVTNSHGRLLKNIYKSHNCVLLNNLYYNEKIFDGDFTYDKAGRKSQNDLCIVNITGLKRITSFNIHNLNFNFSDHKPISTCVQIPVLSGISSLVVAEDLHSNSTDPVLRRPKKVNPDNVNWDVYETLSTQKLENIYGQLCETTSYDSNHFDKIVNEMEDAIYTAAQMSTKSTRKAGNKKTFTPEIRSVTDIDSDLKRNENKKWNNIINCNDPTRLWEEISWNGVKDDIGTCTPSAKDFANYFSSKSKIEEDEVFIMDDNSIYIPVLDDEISTREIKEAGNRLKEKKSSADGWVPGMIKYVSPAFYPVLAVIFNVILRSSLYPSKWRNTIVSTLFKNKGVTWLPKFFRPVSLVQLLSKMFDFILLSRFQRWFQPNDSQSAYQSGKSCADHVFLLRALITHCKSNKAKLFIMCIDFEGAFDRESRQCLFKKLRMFGAVRFLSCLMMIYSSTTCTIFQKEDYFVYQIFAGIKQGLPLSPWLFLFYIDDIFTLFDNTYGRTSILETLHLLIHADDLTMLATSRKKAESKVSTLLEFCGKNYIRLQTSKCEFIVINGDECDKQEFILPYGSIKHVNVVTLLGSQLTESGNLDDDLEYHMKKRFQAVTKFYNFIRSNKLAPTSIKLKVLDACVTTALLHNCEAFGSKVPKDLETIYHTLIKVCLNVRKNVPNLLALTESGMPTLQSMIYSRQIGFVKRFASKLEPNSPRQALYLHLQNGRNKFLEHYNTLLESYDSAKDVRKKEAEALITKVNNLARKDGNSKFKLYLEFNPKLTSCDLTKSHSYLFSRLRLSSHLMPIETGRWSRTPREERLCMRCNVIGDEKHFIYDCPTVSKQDLIDIPLLENLELYDKLPTLLKSLTNENYL